MSPGLVSSHSQRQFTCSSLAYASLLLFCTLLLPASVWIVRDVHAVSPGLTVGQWAHYSIAGNESGGAVDALFTVQSINGPTVTFNDLDTFQDGSTTNDTVIVSISTGPTTPASGQYFVIPPQIAIGQSVYPGDPKHYKNFTIQQITARHYVSSNRQVATVHAQNSTTSYFGNTPPATTYEDFYWDQSTGIITEIVKTLNGAIALHVTMSSTNIWQPDNPISAFLIPSAVVSLSSAAIIGVILVGRYRRKIKLRR